jgi:hypothetical protein
VFVPTLKDRTELPGGANGHEWDSFPSSLPAQEVTDAEDRLAFASDN